jgi:hypothetical protein
LRSRAATLLTALCALVATGSAAAGSGLSVTILRSGNDPRLLAAPGQTVTLSIAVSNLHGQTDIRDTALTVSIPTGLVLKQARPVPNRSAAQRLVWNLGTVKAGAFAQIFELDLQVAPRLSRGSQLSVLAAASGDRSWSGHDAVAATLMVQDPAADLTIESDLNSVPFTAVGPVDFGVKVGNLGTIAASATTLRIKLPAGVSFKSSVPAAAQVGGNVITWQLGDIAPVQSRDVIVKIQPDRQLEAALSHTANPNNLARFELDAFSPAPSLRPTDSHLEIARRVEPAGANLKVWVNVLGAKIPGALQAGKDVIFEVGYGNFGNQTASKVSVSLGLDRGLAMIDSQPPVARSAASGQFQGGILWWEVGEVGIGETASIRTRVHVDSVAETGTIVRAAIAADNDAGTIDKVAWVKSFAMRP